MELAATAQEGSCGVAIGAGRVGGGGSVAGPLPTAPDGTGKSMIVFGPKPMSRAPRGSKKAIAQVV